MKACLNFVMIGCAIASASAGNAAYWPDSCGYALDEFDESSVSAPYIAGPGLVAQESSSGIINGWDERYSRTTFTACDSGRQIDVFSHLEAWGGEETTTDEYAARVGQLLIDFADETRSLTVEDIAARAYESSVYVRTNTVPIETCGCSRFFPELLGQKAKYEGEK